MQEKTISTKSLFEGKIVHLELLDVELPNGKTAQREVIRHRGAAVVLARREDGRFIFVKQFRKPLDRVIIEAVAGTLEPDEDPKICADRELLEEAGYRAQTLQHLGTVYPSPGYVEERMEIYFAQVGSEPESQDLDEDEFVAVFTCTEAEFNGMLRDGKVLDAKTMAAWLLLEKKYPEMLS